VAPLDPGYALVVRGAAANLELADLELAARPAIQPGDSSVAVLVSATTERVTFRRATLRAAVGAKGADATALAPFSPASAPNGTPGALPGAGAATSNPACSASIGGAGARDGAVKGQPGLPALTPAFPAGFSGIGGVDGACSVAGNGANGAYGAAGSAGLGPATLGVLSADGWVSAESVPGGQGGHAQGGGGGAQAYPGGIAGSGGAGGCGGAGGAPGQAGGASVALALFEANVTLLGCSLVTGDGGRGGDGAKGQKAQLGGSGTDYTAKACGGGIGGIGGSGGGGGGGGNGGVSAGILYKGTAPLIDGASKATASSLPRVTLGAGGAPGTKGLGGEPADPGPPGTAGRPGQAGHDGNPGLVSAILEAP
jgi:hypothetical protein